MGRMISNESEIHNLRFRPFPTKPVNVRIVRSGNVMIGIGKNGTVYTNSRAALNGAFVIGDWPWTDATMRALVSMGVISQDVVDRHMADVEKRSLEQSRKRAYESLAELSKEFGIKFTDAQLRKIKEGGQ